MSRPTSTSAKQLFEYLQSLDGLEQLSVVNSQISVQISSAELFSESELALRFRDALVDTLEDSGYLVLWSGMHYSEDGQQIPSSVGMLELIDEEWFPLSEPDTEQQFVQWVKPNKACINNSDIRYVSLDYGWS